jgi:predicted metal-dependent enzyme (double-stranded beta helix superfamily)
LRPGPADAAVLTVDQLVADCQSLIQGDDPEHAVAGYLSQLLRDHSDDVAHVLGGNTGTVVLHQGADLTIAKVVVPAHYAFHPHDHLMWAVVAVVVGREDNTFYVREGDRIAATTGAAYDAGQVGILPESIIHSVRNTSDSSSVGLHVYGGDVVAAPTTEWDPVTGLKRPSAQTPHFQPHRPC